MKRGRHAIATIAIVFWILVCLSRFNGAKVGVLLLMGVVKVVGTTKERKAVLRRGRGVFVRLFVKRSAVQEFSHSSDSLNAAALLTDDRSTATRWQIRLID
jgi:hypothetical protein